MEEAEQLTVEQLSDLDGRVVIEEVLEEVTLVMALTQLSTTAPLKILSKKCNFRAATMPGFSEAMIPALRIDYQLVNDRVNRVKDELTRAHSATIQFTVDGQKSYEVLFDLRHRKGHASGGRFQ